MNPLLPDPSMLAERPLLAAVAALQTLLTATVEILLAEYPNLNDEDAESLGDSLAEGAYADALLQQARALEAILRAYRTVVEAHLRPGLHRQARTNDPHF